MNPAATLAALDTLARRCENDHHDMHRFVCQHDEVAWTERLIRLDAGRATHEQCARPFDLEPLGGAR